MSCEAVKPDQKPFAVGDGLNPHPSQKKPGDLGMVQTASG